MWHMIGIHWATVNRRDLLGADVLVSVLVLTDNFVPPGLSHVPIFKHIHTYIHAYVHAGVHITISVRCILFVLLQVSIFFLRTFSPTINTHHYFQRHTFRKQHYSIGVHESLGTCSLSVWSRIIISRESITR